MQGENFPPRGVWRHTPRGVWRHKCVCRLLKNIYIYIYNVNCFNGAILEVELKEILRKSGKHNKEQEKSINCILCSGIRNRYEDDKYVLAVKKMFEKEMKEKNNKNNDFSS